MGVDHANAYRAAALKHLPWVKVCYDVYHLVSNMNEVVDKVRRAGMAHPTEALKRRLKGKRCHLPKAKENLKEEAGEERAGLPAYNEKLNTTYVPKEQFRTEFCADTQNAATLQLVQWLKMAVVSGVKQVLRPFRYRLFVEENAPNLPFFGGYHTISGLETAPNY